MTNTRRWLAALAILATAGTGPTGGTAAAPFPIHEKDHIAIVGNTM